MDVVRIMICDLLWVSYIIVPHFPECGKLPSETRTPVEYPWEALIFIDEGKVEEKKFKAEKEKGEEKEKPKEKAKKKEKDEKQQEGKEKWGVREKCGDESEMEGLKASVTR